MTISDVLKQQADTKKDQAADLANKAKIQKKSETVTDLTKRIAQNRSDMTNLQAGKPLKPKPAAPSK